MSDATMLADLIARLEAATGPDRDLDLGILNALYGNDWRWVDDEREWVTTDEYGVGAPGNPVCSLLPYTASLDAAMTLVPEGTAVVIGWGQTPDTRPWARLAKPWNGADATGATPAIALCIAALKARSQP
jgi:hypothetical protein